MPDLPTKPWAFLTGLPVADIADALDKIGLTGQSLDPAILPLRPDMQLCGPALCVGTGPAAAGGESGISIYRSIETAITPGAVLLIAGPGPAGAALFGGRLGRILQQRGAQGAIIDGALRDAAELHQIPGCGWFAKGRAPYSYIGRQQFLTLGSPVVIAGPDGAMVHIASGDILCADQDGCLAVPRPSLPALAEILTLKDQ